LSPGPFGGIRTVSLDDAVVARFDSEGHHFEVLIDPDMAQVMRDGEEVDISKLLAADGVWKDARKGDRASEEIILKVFETTELEEVVTKIVMNGDIQLTTDQRRRMTEEKRKQIITYIARHAINPQLKAPHPPQRIENAMNEARISVDPFKAVEAQVKDVLSAIKPLIPIRLEKTTIAVKLSADNYGKVYKDIVDFGVIKKEEWTGLGDWIGLVEIPAGMQGDFFDRLNSKTHGDVETKIMD
jgi:ribosome maturation protein SDO1